MMHPQFLQPIGFNWHPTLLGTIIAFGLIVLISWSLYPSNKLLSKYENDLDDKYRNGEKPSVFSELVGIYHPIYETRNDKTLEIVIVKKLDSAFENDDRFVNKRYQILHGHGRKTSNHTVDYVYTTNYAKSPSAYLNKYENARQYIRDHKTPKSKTKK